MLTNIRNNTLVNSYMCCASLSWAFQQQAVPPKYQYRDPVTADLLLCDQCPPGTAVKQHCTVDSPTECQPCPERHFAENWHWGDTCQYCTSVCKERQLVKQQCNSTHDQLCECAPGFHLVVEFCITHSACLPGYGVTALGTPVSDTVCERCPAGHFSTGSSSTNPCQPHRNCSDLDLKTLKWGTATSDSLCSSQGKTSTAGCSRHQTLCRHQQLPNWHSVPPGVAHCERKVSRCSSLKNLTLDDLLKVANSLPGVKVRQEDVQTVVSTCRPRQYILQLLHLWKTANYDLDLVKGLSHSLRVLRSQGAPRNLLKGLKKISRIIETSSAHKLYEKMFLTMLQDESCFKAHKPLN
uniref:TNFR-Cys domain-containing protein n=1 Tax=Monopterus albus TaxID=43700 RepID=A0A3Q3J3F7_MONAL